MYNSISGMITEKTAHHIVILNNGIEYLVQVSEYCARNLPAEDGEQRVLTYLHHREDQFVLFGFCSEEERNLFHALCKVSGIGPKQALKILSGMSPDGIISALENEDIDGLSGIQGLGRKTAQKIILALHGTLVGSGQEQGGPHNEIIEALTAMGFDRKQAAAAIKTIFQEDQQLSEEEAVKRAIVRLSS
ncbi:MAG: Holliday junction branch migration protein RuvA [Spirochaetales bacterium]|nr:Holliday junction branch migration protein RuvA [Spirochaetales bacterium]